MKSETFVVGLMSGTSLDGIDAALVRIEGFGEDSKISLIEFINEEIPDDIKSEILDCISLEKSNVKLICSLNFKLGKLFANAVKKVCNKANFDMANLDLVGSHGQTIFHLPNEDGKYVKSTLQIGEPAVIAYETNTTVVSNFRTMDMAAGGQGAPLVPYTEYILYKSNKSRAIQNIGGIGNVTVIPKKCKMDDVYAFDTGPGNMIIDEVTRRLKGLKYDKDGSFAAQGKVNKQMISDLMKNEFIRLKPPKTTGREQFGSQFVDELLLKWSSIDANDIIATVTMFTAMSISKNYRKFIFKRNGIDEIILGGGGSYNKTLVKMISDLIPECSVMIQEDIGYSSDAKEAIAFAVLANETMNGIKTNLVSVTGAKNYVLLGNITPKPKLN